MDEMKLKLIQELMEELSDSMEMDKDDFDHRLGKGKSVEVVKVSGDEPMEKAEEVMGEDLDDDMEMGEDPEHAAAVLGDKMEALSPEEKLKERILKMRE